MILQILLQQATVGVGGLYVLSFPASSKHKINAFLALSKNAVIFFYFGTTTTFSSTVVVVVVGFGSTSSLVVDDDGWMGGYHMDNNAVQTILVNNTTFN